MGNAFGYLVFSLGALAIVAILILFTGAWNIEGQEKKYEGR